MIHNHKEEEEEEIRLEEEGLGVNLYSSSRGEVEVNSLEVEEAAAVDNSSISDGVELRSLNLLQGFFFVCFFYCRLFSHSLQDLFIRGFESCEGSVRK